MSKSGRVGVTGRCGRFVSWRIWSSMATSGGVPLSTATAWGTGDETSGCVSQLPVRLCWGSEDRPTPPKEQGTLCRAQLRHTGLNSSHCGHGKDILGESGARVQVRTLTFRLLHCRQPAFDLRWARRPWAKDAMLTETSKLCVPVNGGGVCDKQSTAACTEYGVGKIQDLINQISLH
jgi:hypothetical protein